MDISSFPGLMDCPSPSLYSEQDLERLIELHRRLAEKYHIEQPYFAQTGQPSSELCYHLRNYKSNLHIRCGPIGAFDTRSIAAMIQEQTAVYLAKDAFREDFPIHDPLAIEELLAFMVDGFEPDTLCVLCEHAEVDGYKPLAGAKISFGRSSAAVQQLNGCKQSNLSTLASLKMAEAALARFPEFAHIPEQEVVCMTRLFRHSQQVFQRLQVNDGKYFDLVSDVFALLVLTYHTYMHVNGRDVRYALLDTHLSKIGTFFEEKFGALLLASADEIELTEYMLQTIVRYHYEFYHPTLHILAVPTEAYLQGAAKMGFDHLIRDHA